MHDLPASNGRSGVLAGETGGKAYSSTGAVYSSDILKKRAAFLVIKKRQKFGYVSAAMLRRVEKLLPRATPSPNSTA